MVPANNGDSQGLTDGEFHRGANGDSERVLVIAAHPDDEVLGCGGTIAIHRCAGHSVTVVIVAAGRPGSGPVSDQTACAKPALRVLGVDDVRLLGLPDQQLDRMSLTEMIAPLQEAVEDVRPTVVYCQHGGDVNRDHQLVFQAAMVATRPVQASIRALYTFDTASSTEWAFPRTFVPDTWVDISGTLDRKLRAMERYESELRAFPHPRSIEGLRYRAQAWGAQCCVPAAEVFMTVRRVLRNGQALS
jgi:LmbE family N-acetylglucosaminyl deacetylase